jgi:hypothetical protein
LTLPYPLAGCLFTIELSGCSNFLGLTALLVKSFRHPLTLLDFRRQLGRTTQPFPHLKSLLEHHYL